MKKRKNEVIKKLERLIKATFLKNEAELNVLAAQLRGDRGGELRARAELELACTEFVAAAADAQQSEPARKVKRVKKLERS